MQTVVKQIVKQYDARLDKKKRLTIRGAPFNFYHVNEFSDGTLLLKPQTRIDSDEISENTLRIIDLSMENF